MDKNSKEQLRSLTKKHGLRDKYENIIKNGTHVNIEAWYDQLSPLYAISRLIPLIVSTSDKDRFVSLDKEWVSYLVNTDKCAILADYVTRHTKPVVIQAIHYLMDNNLWESPKGAVGLRKDHIDFYKGICAIDEAVEYLRSENKLSKEQTAKEQQPTPGEEIIDFGEINTTGIRSGTRQTLARCNASLQALFDNFKSMREYFENDELADLLEKENIKLEKENQQLTESIKTVTAQLKAANKETEAQKQAAYQVTKERNLHIDNFNKLKKQYDEVKGEYEYLKREASQKPKTVPAAKIIALSKLRDLPLIGPTVLKSLIPFLKQYNIIVDENK